MNVRDRVGATLALLVLSACGGAGARPAASSGSWYADYDQAALAAKSQKKDLLVDFTGSDWCGWCMKLHDEVFSKPEFESEAQKRYVLVALDFPQGPEARARVPNPARNAELAAKYRIEGYPTVLALTPDGDVLAKMGYEPGGPRPWLDHLAVAAVARR
jgi:thiol-disulfide isomerase/thioredoxin